MSAAPFALDHLTAVEATPPELVEIASRAGYGGICLFLRTIEGLGMAGFDLVEDPGLMTETALRLEGSGVSLDLAYPFTLSSRTQAGDFERDLDAAARLGARAVNVLVFDRDLQRRQDAATALCQSAETRNLGLVIEFFPASAVRSLAEAVALVEAVDRPAAGVNLDLLHLHRSGGRVEDIAHTPSDLVRFVQICDGPYSLDPACWREEASLQRALPGQGEFDIGRALELLPAGTPRSIEVPDLGGRQAGESGLTRARRALQATLGATVHGR